MVGNMIANHTMRSLYPDCRNSHRIRRPSPRPVNACPWLCEIEARTQQGAYSVRIFAGEPSQRWARAKRWRQLCGEGTATLLVPGTNPLGARWFAGTAIADISGLPGDQVHALCQALTRDGVELAYLIDLTDAARSIRLVAEAAQEAACRPS